MSLFTGIAKNTLSQVLSRLASIVISLVLTGVLYRVFAEEGFGAYSFISAFVLFFGHISDWGTNIIAVREASRSNKNRPVIFGSLILFRLFLALASVIVVNIVVRVNPNWSSLVLPTSIASLLLIFLSLKTSAAMIFQTIMRLDLSALIDFLSSLAFLFLALFSIALFQDNLNTLMLSWFLATVFAGIIGLLLAIRSVEVVWKPDKTIIKNIFLEAVPTGALLIVFSLYNRIDIVILQHFQGSAAVAPYALAYKVFDNVVLGAAFLMNSLFPIFSREFVKTGNTKLKAYYQKTFDVLLLSASLLFIGIFLLSPVIVGVLSGNPDNPAIGLLRILSFAVFIAYFNHLTGFSLIAFGKQKLSLTIAIAALSFNVIANLLLIPKYSYFASAYTTVATEILVLLISSFVIWRKVGILPSLFSLPKTLFGFWCTILNRK